MASFIYFYAKFTEEFLLLGAAGIFTLLSVYCYHWVIKKRRLGAARDLVPAGMVKVYLNQLIDEAQFVRTQLFGLIGGGPAQNLADFEGIFARNTTTSSPTPPPRAAASGEAPAGIPNDLLERLHALEDQLSEKEGMVVNINVEKSKLLEEIEHLKQNQNAIQLTSGSAGNNDELVKKVKTLEQRLEEYSLFEDDLANLKRLQQENSQLKKRIEEIAPAPAVDAAPEAKATPGAGLDQSAIDALLNGVSPTPPEEKIAAEKAAAAAPVVEADADQAAIDALVAASQAPTVAEETPAVAAPKAAAPAGDDFEKLVDSVEDSLEQKKTAAAASTPERAPKAPAPSPVAAASAPKTEAPSVEALAEKSDEELLKEFENLLNS
jgi:hypothetical protein